MLKKWTVTVPSLSGDTPRKAYIWLPDSYEDEPEKRYPVLYMFDGHNIFLDEEAAFGKSWGMKDYMEKTGKELIIVAVECNHEGNHRLMEYTPVSYRNAKHGVIPARAATYMKWMTHWLKPFIDRHYRTLPEPENTALAGSSMGGLIALYGAISYNHVFRKAASLSPSFWVAPAKMLALVSKAVCAEDTVIYMSYGQKEMGNHKANRWILGMISRELYCKGVNLTFRVVPGADHSEGAWEKQVPAFMECLGL